MGDKQGIAYALNNLGHLTVMQRDFAQATVLLAESLTLCREIGEQQGIASNLEGLARLAAASASAPADLERAVRLFGAAAALREAIGMPLPANERASYDRATAAVQAAVGEIAWATLLADGQALLLEDAISLALGAQPQS